MSLPSITRPAIRRAATASSAHGSVAMFANPQCQQRTFSTTPELNERKTRRDNNKMRGMSAMYGSKIRKRMQIMPHEIGKPVVGFKPTVETDPNHGLWQFFYDKQALAKGVDLAAHGRAWTVEELRKKSWEDLHKLWWTCIKERNRLHTYLAEFRQQDLQVGDAAKLHREGQVNLTMRRIKHVLTERFYTWEDARALAAQDPEVDLTSTTNPYTPIDYLEAEEAGSLEDGSEGEVQAAESASISAEKATKQQRV